MMERFSLDYVKKISIRGFYIFEIGFFGDLWFRNFGFLFFGVLLLVEIGVVGELGFRVVIFSG